MSLRTYKTLANRALQYRRVARWADAFQRGRFANADMHQTGHPRTVRPNVACALIAECLEDDRRWSLQELQAHTVLIRQLLAYDVQGVILCHMVKLLMHSTMLHICKITSAAQFRINGHNCKM